MYSILAPIAKYLIASQRNIFFPVRPFERGSDCLFRAEVGFLWRKLWSWNEVSSPFLTVGNLRAGFSPFGLCWAHDSF